MKLFYILNLTAAASIAATASADITGAYVVSYAVNTTDFGGAAVSVNVQDLYLSSDDGADVALNVYNMQMSEAGKVDFESLNSLSGHAVSHNAASTLSAA